MLLRCCRRHLMPDAATGVSHSRPLQVSFYQVVTLFGDVYQVQYPQMYLGFLDWFSVLNFDFVFVLRLECAASGFNWHVKMYGIFAMFTGLAVIQLTCFAILESRAAEQQGAVASVTEWVALITYACYPSFSNGLFQAFNCHTVGDVSYLRHDYQILCDDPAHKVAQDFAWAGIATCSIGIPVLYLFVLYRAVRKKDGARERITVPYLAFFYDDYKDEFWYWEAIELTRKLLLTGFAALWMPGTLMQMVASMCVIIANIAMIGSCKPYCGHALSPPDSSGEEENVDDKETKNAGDKKNANVVNSFALTSATMVFFSLLGALLVKFHTGFTSNGVSEEGYSFAMLQWLLISTAACIGVFGTLIIAKEYGAGGISVVLHSAAVPADPFAHVANRISEAAASSGAGGATTRGGNKTEHGRSGTDDAVLQPQARGQKILV